MEQMSPVHAEAEGNSKNAAGGREIRLKNKKTIECTCAKCGKTFIFRCKSTEFMPSYCPLCHSEKKREEERRQAAEMAAYLIMEVARELPVRFREWVDRLEIGTEDRPLKNLFSDERVLCFNYTDSLKNVVTIIVIGHSLSPVDGNYFRQVADNIPKAHWYFGCHGIHDLENIRYCVFSPDSTLLFVIVSGMDAGIPFFRLSVAGWEYIDEMETIPHQNLINRRLRHVYLAGATLTFVYNSRIRIYSLETGELIENQGKMGAKDMEFEGVEIGRMFKK